MNNQNIFQKRAAERNADKFSNTVPFKTTPQEVSIVEEEEMPVGNIFQRHAAKNVEKKNNQFGFLDTIKDIGQQVASKGVSGAAGAYGNLLDTFGLQIKEGEQLPGQEARNNMEFEILQKMEQPGYKPSFSDFAALSDDDIVPNYSRLPTSKEVQKGIEQLTGIGEGKTPEGRIAGRGAEFVGEGAATGGGLKALATLAGSGLAGQGIREAGGPEALATGTEIAGSILPSLLQGRLVPKGSDAKKTVEAGRHIGLTEKQITPLVQGEKKVATLSKVARKGTKTKELFASIKQKLGDSYDTIKSSKEAKVNLPRAEQKSIIKEFSNIRNELLKTLEPSPDKQAAIDYIGKAINKLQNNTITPEHLVNFWQDINKSVKWNSLSGGKKSLAALKDPISKTLNKISPSLAKDFEMTNDLYSKYSQISKKLKPDLIDAIVNKGELLGAVPAGIALATGNPWGLVGLASEASIRLLGREMLINPYFQNLGMKLVKNFNQGSAKGVSEIVKQVQEYMSRKHPNEKWDFLNADLED